MGFFNVKVTCKVKGKSWILQVAGHKKYKNRRGRISEGASKMQCKKAEARFGNVKAACNIKTAQAGFSKVQALCMAITEKARLCKEQAICNIKLKQKEFTH